MPIPSRNSSINSTNNSKSSQRLLTDMFPNRKKDIQMKNVQNKSDSDSEIDKCSQESVVEPRNLKYSFDRIASKTRKAGNNKCHKSYEAKTTINNPCTPKKPMEIMKVHRPITQRDVNTAVDELEQFGSQSEMAFSPITPHDNSSTLNDSNVTIEYYNPADPSTSVASTNTQPTRTIVNVLDQTIIPPDNSNTINIAPPFGKVITRITLELVNEGATSTPNNIGGISNAKSSNNNPNRGISATGNNTSTTVVNANDKRTNDSNDEDEGSPSKKQKTADGSAIGLTSTPIKQKTVVEDVQTAGPSASTSCFANNNDVSKAKRVLFGKKKCQTDVSKSDSSIREDESFEISPKKVGNSNKKFSPKSPRKYIGKNSTIGSPKKLKTNNEKTPNFQLLRKMVTLIIEVYKTIHFKNLLKKEQQVFLKFGKLDDNCKYVVFKLFTSKKDWHGVSKFCEHRNMGISKNDIIDLYHTLKDNGFIDTDCANTDLSVHLNLLDKQNLKEICKTLNATPRVKSKDLMVQSLLKKCIQQTTLTSTPLRTILKKQIEDHMGYSMRLKESVFEAFYRVFTLGTFMNHQIRNPNDYFYMVQKIDGQVTVFPEFNIESYVIFESRDACLSFIKAKRLKEEYEEIAQRANGDVFYICDQAFHELSLINKNNDPGSYENMHKEVPHLRKYTAEYVYINIITKGCQKLFTKQPENVKNWLQFFIKTYPNSHRISAWYGQLAWLYTRYIKPPDHEKAAQLLIEVIEQKPELIDERGYHELLERRKWLFKGKKISQMSNDKLVDLLPVPIEDTDISENRIDAHTIRENQRSRKRDYVITNKDGDKVIMKVEEVALHHYKEAGYTEGCHCEGSTIKSLFVLLFWDIIYNPSTVVPGTFLSLIQTAPLDIFTPYFYKNRQDLIDKRIDEIISGWSDLELLKFAKSMWKEHSHKSAVFGEVKNTLPFAMVEIVLKCIKRDILGAIFQRLVKNLGRFSSGMPDLLVWNPDKKLIKFVEVKGEGDSLSVTQRLWLKYLQEIGADAEVCHVHSIGSKRKGNKVVKKMVASPETE